MVLLGIDKPERNLAHFKALLYADLYNKGFDVHLDVWSNALYEYTSGVKGYQKTKFDIVIFVEDKARLIVNFSKNSRRKTKIGFYRIPIVNVDVDKWEKSYWMKEVIKKLTY